MYVLLLHTVLGSWDQEVSIWDPRQRNRIVSRPQNERVYAMDCVENTLVVGTAQRKILIWDLRNLGQSHDETLIHIKCSW